MTKHSLGFRLRAARLAGSMSQTELSERSGIPKPTLSRYENDHVSPSLRTLHRLSIALGVSDGELINEEDSPDEAFLTALRETLREDGVRFKTVAEAQRAARVVADSLRTTVARRSRAG